MADDLDLHNEVIEILKIPLERVWLGNYVMGTVFKTTIFI